MKGQEARGGRAHAPGAGAAVPAEPGGAGDPPGRLWQEAVTHLQVIYLGNMASIRRLQNSLPLLTVVGDPYISALGAATSCRWGWGGIVGGRRGQGLPKNTFIWQNFLDN